MRRAACAGPFLVDKLGYVPNANSWSTTNCSQPPLLAWMVRDIFANTGDRDWLIRVHPWLNCGLLDE